MCIRDRPTGEDLAKACAGFDAHLDMLAAALEGVSIKFPFDVFVQARKAYAEQVTACLLYTSRCV